MPGAGFKREAFRIRHLVRKMMDTPYDMVKSAMVRRDTCGGTLHILTRWPRLRVMRGRHSPLLSWKKRLATADLPKRKLTTSKAPRLSSTQVRLSSSREHIPSVTKVLSSDGTFQLEPRR